MKVRTENKEIKIYTTSDGKEFEHKWNAEQHQKSLEAEPEKTRIKNKIQFIEDIDNFEVVQLKERLTELDKDINKDLKSKIEYFDELYGKPAGYYLLWSDRVYECGDWEYKTSVIHIPEFIKKLTKYDNEKNNE